MEIDLFTFCAQVLNFMILVAILRRVLYRPLLQVMEQRDQAMAQRRQEVEERWRQAQELQATCQQALQELEKERARRLAELADEVDRARAEALEGVRREVSEQDQRWRQAQEREREARGAQEVRQLGRLVVEVSRQALAELAGADLEERLVEQLLTRLNGSLPSGPALVRCAHPLSARARSRLEQALPGARYEVDPGLTLGLVLQWGDTRLGWSLDSYLENLEEALRRC